MAVHIKRSNHRAYRALAKGMEFVEKTGSRLSKERAVLPTRLLVWAPDIPLWEVTLTTALK